MNTAGHPPLNRTAPPPSKLWKADVIKKLETCVFSLAYIWNARGKKLSFVLLLGVIHKPCSHQGGEGGLKISQNWLRYRYKSVYVRGEGGSKITQKMATWFMNDPIWQLDKAFNKNHLFGQNHNFHGGQQQNYKKKKLF